MADHLTVIPQQNRATAERFQKALHAVAHRPQFKIIYMKVTLVRAPEPMCRYHSIQHPSPTLWGSIAMQDGIHGTSLGSTQCRLSGVTETQEIIHVR